ncbi:TPA: hypothetical protein KIA93_000323 [Salmonella enterica]|uniref:hypothetical protein n=1 Tax=Salmonella enterica TaxID=28901 RepID=UPI0009AFA75D|nr:hypothetical protein [Salmonella enterica]HBD1844117.1 hypothetical protein [Salmonella enterica]
MTVQENLKRPKRRLLYWGAGAGIAVGVALALYGVANCMNGLDGRLALLEKQQHAVLHADDLNELQKAVAQLSTSARQNSEQIQSIRQVLAQQQPDNDLAKVTVLEEKLKALSSEQNTFETRLATLSDQVQQIQQIKQPTAPAVATPSTKTVKPAATTKKTTASKPGSIQVARNAPFVLTGIELRGAHSYAAVAPRGYNSLSQVYLLGEGETFSGWTLVQVNSQQAHFRANGRVVAIGVE